MKSVKEEVMSVAESLPENATLDDAMYQLYVLNKIAKAEEDVLLGKMTDNNKLREEIEKW